MPEIADAAADDYIAQNRTAWDRMAADYVASGRRNWVSDAVTWGIFAEAVSRES